MLAAVRRAQVHDTVSREGFCRVTELAAMLDVSEMTVRRDLEVLALDGKVHKVHGGAVRITSANAVEPEFAEKAQRARAQKARIGTRAARLVRPATALGIGAGSTTAAFAHRIAHIPDLTVVTNSIAVSEAFHHSTAQGQTVILTGGQRTPSDALVGPAATRTLEGLHLDQVFLGTHGLGLDSGLTTPNLVEADTNRALLACAEQVVLLADSSKWLETGLASFADLEQVHILVTDAVPTQVREEATSRLGSVILTDRVR
ncbi:MAG: DeoR/GlpR family DNA-binding transcription regulator [Mycobacteriales bacterium]